MTGSRVDGRAGWITVRGARTNNLRDVSVRVPKHRITVFTGVSGSGKSSLAFGTIAAEAQRLVADTYPRFVRGRMPHTGRADVDRIDGLTFPTIVDQLPFTGSARSTVGTASDIAPLLRMLFSRIGIPSAGYSPAYSFNDPAGMCPRCEGLGTIDEIDHEALLDRSRSLRDGAIRFPAFAPGTYRWKRLVHAGLVDPDRPLSAVAPDALDALLYAEGLRLTDPDPEYPKTGLFDGVIPRLRGSYLRKAPSRLTQDLRDALKRVVTHTVCPDCHGARLNASARASLIDGRSIADWSAMPVSELVQVITALREPRVGPLVAAIRERLDAMETVDLGYLSLDRLSPTLSGGEAQRVKIVRHLGSALSDVCYVFDEPTSGLHPHDVHRLLRLLAQLRDAHNTVLVVEHHPSVIAAADHIIDLGPGAGADGGLVQFEGAPRALRAAGTATGRMLHEPLRVKRWSRESTSAVIVRHATTHNLQDLTVRVPLGVLTAVTGVAGSGKSSLASHEIPCQHPEFTMIGREWLHGGSRSTPATVLGIADPIRQAFGSRNGMATSWFSPNARGACPQCRGRGFIVTDLAFLDDVRTTCEACHGSRFNPTALAATLYGHSIADVLAMDADTATVVLDDLAGIADRLAWLREVGLGYLAIGQAVDTLSGGERQRLLLAKHLADTTDPAQLRLVLDEPTSGLHGNDTDRFLVLVDRLIDAGATVVAIEHDLRVVAHADHVIDIGLGAGAHGGRVVYQGPASGLLTHPRSLTGRHLRLMSGSGTSGCSMRRTVR